MILQLDLSKKKCVACEGIGRALNIDEVQTYLQSVDSWEADSSGKRITREYTLKNFMAAVRMITQIAEIAEAENHHPDLHLTSYKKLRIELSTHALDGLTENDFILAAKINQLTDELKV